MELAHHLKCAPVRINNCKLLLVRIPSIVVKLKMHMYCTTYVLLYYFYTITSSCNKQEI